MLCNRSDVFPEETRLEASVECRFSWQCFKPSIYGRVGGGCWPFFGSAGVFPQVTLVVIVNGPFVKKELR